LMRCFMPTSFQIYKKIAHCYRCNVYESSE
jgi:hypothetical protein